MSVRRIAIIVTLVVACAASAQAQSVKIQFHDGKVDLTTQNAPIRTILTEWARAGGTQLVNIEKVTGAALTLQLTNVPETQALDTILRGTAGYLVGQRASIAANQSTFDRILLVPTAGTSSVAAARPITAPPPFTPTPVAQPQPDPDDNPAGDVPPDDDRPVRPQQPGARPQPFQPGDQGQPQQPPPTASPANPFGVQPGSSRPGEITPVPQPQQRPRSQPDNEP